MKTRIMSVCNVVQDGETSYPPQYDGSIGGVDISDVLPGGNTLHFYFFSPAAIYIIKSSDYDRALGRFMRNEIDYDEFMRLTGGQTLEEEMAADGGVMLFVFDLGESVEDEEDYEYGTSEVSSVSKLFSIVDDELGTCRSDVHLSAVSTDQPSATGTSATFEPTVERERVPRKLSKTMDALLGHANVIYAKGNTQEALAVLLEVIRQEPRNAASYRQVSDIYQELGDSQKSLQYGLLAAHLDPRTPAEDWAHWGDESKKLELIEEAAACYGRAIRLDVKNWKYYENRIEMLDILGIRPLAMRTRLQAAQMINPSQAGVDFEWFHELIKTVAQYYITINDEDRAILALEAFVLRSKEFGRSADNQHETLIGMWIAKSKFTEAAKSIFALCDGISTTDKSNMSTAMESFEKVLQVNPGHVDARINLSSLQQKMGLSDRALETLQDHDLDTCTHLPDERLLIQQADVLFESEKTEQFIRCCRMLLTPHFYEVHRNQENVGRRRSSKTGFYLSNTLRVAAMNAITNTNWEKFVRRLGSTAFNERRSLHDYCLKLIECLLARQRFQDMLIVCCYAFLQPRITKSDKSSTFQNMLYFCAIKAHCWPVAFEYIRHFQDFPNDLLYKRIFNAMNYIFVHSQNVSYHRYIMRSLAKSPGNHALQAISGNNSLITGTYRHALGEYLRVWNENKKNPLICLLLALTFTHMACKKDLSSRHMIGVRGVAFMKKYDKNRACRQESHYNIARMFHQMSITPLAIHFYEKVNRKSIIMDTHSYIYIYIYI
uniref:TPR_REGION domain-containing protein n=1 Tax=Angiostrongylus cantonensis TaxID=6313 RepID=A0A158PAQ8_ANGCA